MKSLAAFKASLKDNKPDPSLSVQLLALWYDGKGNWHEAHKQVDELNDISSAHVHAYLHRKEGDNWNADYWYRKANQSRPKTTLDEEWENLVIQFL
ncbi:hypothetical protein [Pedobacter aquatilis]|uniref:hypothetical protein n=1 Tax=Pedobacter aquatilis TaxID=351343 RepID=UPI00292CF785|nr:hypothetical protein [Pedobacter aquatilis]